MRWPPNYARIAAAAACLLLSACEIARAEPADFWLRRIFVPADDLASWPTEGQTFVPVASDRLNRFLAPPQTERRIIASSASYRLALSAAGEVSGSLAMEFAADGGPLPCWLAIDAAGVRLVEARHTGSQAAVVLGAIFDADDTARLGLLLESLDGVEVDWTARPTTQTAGVVPIPLPQVATLAATIVVECPAKYDIEVQPGQLVVANQIDDNLRRIEVACAPGALGELRLVDSAAQPLAEVTSAGLTEEVRHELSASGDRMTSRFSWRAAGFTQSNVICEIPPGAMVLAVSVDGVAQTFRQPGEQLPRRIVVELPAAAAQQTRTCEIELWQPLPLGEVARLPNVSLRGMTWLEGSIDIQLDPLIELIDLRAESLVPVVSPDDTSPLTRWQKVDRDATCEVIVSRRQQQLTCDLRHRVMLGTSGTETETLWQIEPTQQRLPLAIDAELGDDWIVESVRCDNPALLSDWYLDHRSGSRKLVLQFDATIQQQQPARISVVSRLARSASAEWLSLSALAPFALQGVDCRHQLLTLSSVEGLEIKTAGVPAWVDATTLSLEQQALLGSGSTTTIIDLSQQVEGASVRLESKPSEAEFMVATRVRQQQDNWQCEYEFRCEPKQGAVDRCEIYFSRPLVGEVVWRDRAAGTALRAELQSKDELAARQLAPEGELWLVRFGEPREDVQQFSVSSTLAAASEIDVPLAAPFGAQVAAATIELLVDGRNEVGYLPLRLDRLPLADGGQQSSPVARWSYAAGQVLATASEMPKLRLSADARASRVARVVLLDATLETRCGVARPWLHRYRAVVRRGGTTELEYTLPSSADNIRYQVDQQAIRSTSSTTVVVPLETQLGESVVTIEFETDNNRLQAGAWLSPAWPRCEAPVVASHWRLDLPGEFRIAQDGEEPQTQHAHRAQFLALPPVEVLPTAAARATADATSGRPQTTVSRVGALVSDVKVYHQGRTRLVATAVLAMALAAGYFLAARSLQWVVVVLVLGAVWQLTTTPWGGLVAAALVGVLIAGAWRFVAQVRPAAMLLIAGLALSTPAAMADEATPVQRVLVPADAEGNPVGEQAFVTPELLQEIARHERNMLPATPDFVVTRAELAVTLQAVDAQQANLQWTLQVCVRRADCRIVLPLSQSAGEWQTTARISGIPVTIDWRRAGTQATFLIAEPGDYDVVLQVRQQVAAASPKLQADVPAAPGVRVSINSPEALRGLSINNQACPQQTTSSGLVASIDLPAVRTLTIDWQAASISPVATNGNRVEMSSLLHVDSESTYLDLQITPQSFAAGKPLLVPLDFPATASLVTQSPSNTFRSPLAIDKAGHLVIDSDSVQTAIATATPLRVRIEIERNQPLGVIALPVGRLPLDCRGTHVLGVACDASLDAQLPQAAVGAATGGLAKIDVDDFLASRSDELEMTSSVRTAANVGGIENTIQVVVRPRGELSGSEESLRILCQPQGCQVRYQTDFAAPSWPRARQVLSVSKELSISMVEANTSTGALPLTYHRLSPSRLVVLFSQPIQRPYRLRIEGELPADAKSQLAWPKIVAVGNATTSQRVTLYADPRLIVDVPDAAGLTRLSGSTYSTPAGWLAYPVGNFRVDESAIDSMTMTFRPNRLRYRVDSVQRVQPRGPAWEVDNLAVVQVEQGNLVELEVDLPGDVSGPFTVEPPAYVSVAAESDGRSQRLRLRFPQAMAPGSNHLVRIRYAATSTGPQFAAQLPRYVGTGDARQWFATPIDATDGIWQIENARRGQLPEELAARCDPTMWSIYRVRSPGRLVAQWRSRAAIDHKLALALAEHRLTIDTPGNTRVTSRLLFLPSVEEECVLQLPEGSEVIDLRVDGSAALAASPAADQLAVSLGPGQLPHLLEIDLLVDSRPPRGDSLLTCRAPQVASELANQRETIVLWSIDDGDGSTSYLPNEAQRLSPANVAALRLRSWVDASTNLPVILTAWPTAGNSMWPPWWQRQLRLLEQQATAVSASSAKADVVQSTDAAAALESLVASCQAISQQLSDTAAPEVPPEPPMDQSASVWVSNSPELTLRRTLPADAPPAHRQGHWFIGLFVVATLAIGWTSRRRHKSLHPCLLAALAGVGLAVVMQPAWLGWAIASVALVAWLRLSSFSIAGATTAAAR